MVKQLNTEKLKHKGMPETMECQKQQNDVTETTQNYIERNKKLQLDLLMLSKKLKVTYKRVTTLDNLKRHIKQLAYNNDH